MTSLAEFVLPDTAFPLGRIFETRPEARLELDRVVPNADTVMPFFWVHDADGEMREVLSVFDGLTELRSVTLMEDLGDKGLFRAEWNPEYMGIMGAVAAADVTVISASGSKSGWTFELRAEAVRSFSQFQAYCDDHEIPVTLARLNRLTETTTGRGYNLTEGQYEALILAFERGYYDEPRETNLEELAEELGISRPSFSARLKRGYRNLLTATIVDQEP
ncbi:GAF and HTH_10 associated domain-containing protein [Halopelagius inordinatus]|uniref:GAF and HTH_10 associated domain-containing protein n=1 Tax=Halopelagius inordinatus TaxID=553467 RepID=A0A1I2MBI9_9EURY|nr:helix-turn-helix domain-containing protein [Halopelagius inordinatus]SFF88822.1 GAF and HTH_10 associated domain-containing protein [Halopelagius inordinatus]